LHLHFIEVSQQRLSPQHFSAPLFNRCGGSASCLARKGGLQIRIDDLREDEDIAIESMITRLTLERIQDDAARTLKINSLDFTTT